MGYETSGAEPEHEGEEYLRLIDFGQFADQTITRKDGTPMVVRDFLEDERCAKFARPAFIGLKSLSPDDPRYEPVRNTLRTQVAQLLGITLEG